MEYIVALIKTMLYPLTDLIAKYGNKAIMEYAMDHFPEHYSTYLYYVLKTKWPSPEEKAFDEWYKDHSDDIIF